MTTRLIKKINYVDTGSKLGDELYICMMKIEDALAYAGALTGEYTVTDLLKLAIDVKRTEAMESIGSAMFKSGNL